MITIGNLIAGIGLLAIILAVMTRILGYGEEVSNKLFIIASPFIFTSIAITVYRGIIKVMGQQVVIDDPEEFEKYNGLQQPEIEKPISLGSVMDDCANSILNNEFIRDNPGAYHIDFDFSIDGQGNLLRQLEATYTSDDKKRVVHARRRYR